MTDVAEAPENALSMQQAPACVRRREPDFKEPCENPATGGVMLALFAHERLQRKYGRRPLLKLLLDLPVCAGCFSRMTAMQVLEDGLAPGQWGAFSKIAQQRNYGVLPIRENSTIEHVGFDDPEYQTLRNAQAKREAACG